QLASGLVSKFNLKPGDRVAFAMKNCPQYWELMFACWHSGLAAVPMNAKLHAKEFAYIVGNCGAKACFFDPKEFENLKGEPQKHFQTLPDDLAWLFYTSGTTGVPKGAMLTHRNLLFATQAYFSDIDKLGPRDAILHPAPLSHGSGLYGLPHFAAGAVNVIPRAAISSRPRSSSCSTTGRTLRSSARRCTSRIASARSSCSGRACSSSSARAKRR